MGAVAKHGNYLAAGRQAVVVRSVRVAAIDFAASACSIQLVQVKLARRPLT